MKRLVVAVLLCTVLLCLCACSEKKSGAIINAEEAIGKIGTVTIDSKEAIKEAGKLYNLLTDAEKAKVENRLVLIEAQEAYSELLKQFAFDNAKIAYEKITEAATICADGMDDIYDSWYFGIYDAEDYSSSTVAKYLSYEVSFSEAQIKQACTDLGISTYYLTYDWNYCVFAIEQAHTNAGTYSTLELLLIEASNAMQLVSENYSDYENYPKLKEYYAKVSSYVDFFKNTTGSFNQLADTIKDYENAIRTYQSDLSYLFK